MADENGAASQGEAQPKSLDMNTAADRFQSIMDGGEERQKKTKDLPAGEGQAEQETPPPERAAPEDGAEQPAEVEAQEAVELPDTLDGLAGMLGVTADDLLARLTVQLKAAGQDRKVTLADLQKGFQLDADYRQKTSVLADQQRQFDQAVEVATHKWQDAFQRTTALTALLEQQVGARDQAYWDAYLRDHGAEAYLGERAKWEAQMGAVQRARDEQNRIAGEQATQTAQQRMSYRKDQQQKLAAADPIFADPAKASDFDKRFGAYLQETYKFTPQEVSEWTGGVWDHRHVLIAKKAMLYDDLQKAKPEVHKKLANLPKVIVPGAARPKAEGAAEANRQTLNRARKTGKTEDIAKVFEKLHLTG